MVMAFSARRITAALLMAFLLADIAVWGQSPNSSNDKIASPWEDALKSRIDESPQIVRLGKQVYQTRCFICHGRAGDGQGSASQLMRTKPRNFTLGEFKLRTTPWGALPTDDDLFRTVSLGFPQYGMPSL